MSFNSSKLFPNTASPFLFRLVFPALLLSLFAAPVLAGDDEQTDYRSHPEFSGFAERMQRKYGMDPGRLDELFTGVYRQQRILDAISSPTEGKDWQEYRPIFLTGERIEAGVEFWNKHAATLARAEREFGVDAETIVAIIGIETYYGRISGSWRVIEALSTLAFDYPPRQKFFRSELEHFLQLVTEEDIDIHNVQGSYAGAMGGGQFMPSSYRQYAVDFDKDGQRNLWKSWPDIIGSIAHYLSRYGWEHGAVIAVPAAATDNARPPLQEQGMTVENAGQLRKAGLVFSETVENDAEVRLVGLQHEDELTYWIGLKNFYVITRYNRSPLYAMAVTDLGRAITDRRLRQKLQRDIDQSGPESAGQENSGQ